MKTGLDALHELQGDWSKVKRLIPYGFGEELKKHIARLLDDFDIPFIVDSDPKKWGEVFKGIEVVSHGNLNSLDKDDKVLICIAGRAKEAYDEIKEVLGSHGMKENVDFCRLSQFEVEWYYRYRGEYCLYRIDMAVTTACSLKCTNCNMFVRYYKKPFNVSYNEAIKSIDLLMDNIDYLFKFAFLGGEPLLHPDLEKLLVYLHKKYKHKIGQLSFTTNGTIIPNETLLKTMEDLDVNVEISDYTEAIGRRSKVEELAAVLKERGISYGVLRNRIWCKTGFPEEPRNIPDEDAKRHMLDCNGWRGLNDGKYYFCNIAWSAEKAGLFKLRDGDYIDLEMLQADDEESKKKLLEFSLGKLPNDYMSFCKVCGSCGSDNKDFVLAGEQSV